MKPGDLVKNKNSDSDGEIGLFMGLRTFKASSNEDQRQDYICAEVMWFTRNAPNGDRVSTIQKDFLEVINETR